MFSFDAALSRASSAALRLNETNAIDSGLVPLSSSCCTISINRVVLPVPGGPKIVVSILIYLLKKVWLRNIPPKILLIGKLVDTIVTSIAEL
jgi:hypothetical protein